MSEFEEVARNLDAIGGKLEDHKRERGKLREDFEALERKVNLLSVSGAALGHDAIAPDEEFRRAMKSWYPGRAASADGCDYGVYRKAFAKYMRQGLDALDPEERKAMSVSSDSEGGYLAPSELVREMIRAETDNSVIRGIARVLPAGAGDVEFPASLTRPAVGWVGESPARNATASPLVGTVTFNVKELYAMTEATQKLIDDSVFDIEAFLG